MLKSSQYYEKLFRKMIVEKDALEMASKADAVILALSFNAASEPEGGDRGVGRPL